MNEKLSQAGGMVKQAFTKVRDHWKEQEPARKKRILVFASVLVAAAILLAVLSSAMGGRYVTLYQQMSREQVVEGLSVLQNASIPSRINQNTGYLEVPASRENEAMGQLAMAGLPSMELGYSIFESGTGLTTTQSEKYQYQVNQTQNRLQDIIKTMPGVQNAYVTLVLNNNSYAVWDETRSQNSGSVKIDLAPGYVLTPGQVEGIRYLVGSGAGIEPTNVAVLDTNGTMLAATGDEYMTNGDPAQLALSRLGVEQEYELRIKGKANEILSLVYPEPNSFVVAATVKMDYDQLSQELMEYIPLEDTGHGVLGYEDVMALLGVGQYAEGIVGEDQNTDVPEYADLDGDGEWESVDYSRAREFLVSYLNERRERTGPELVTATVSVVITAALTTEERQVLRESIGAANNLPIDNITVHGIQGTAVTPPAVIGSGSTIFGLPAMFVYIAGGTLLVVILALTVMLLLRSRGKKKRLAAERAAEQAEQEEAERIQREIEERKKQLKDAATGDQSDSAITNEVRDFARSNPEITANLLRTWLKEGES